MLPVLLTACGAPAPGPLGPVPSSGPESTAGSSSGDPATQVGAEGTNCTGCFDGIAATLVFPSDPAPLDAQAVLVTSLEPEDLELTLLAEEVVSGSTELWPLVGGGHAVLLTPDELLAPEAGHEVHARSVSGSSSELRAPFWTGDHLSGAPGSVEVLSVEPASVGLTIELQVEVDEPCWVRVHEGSCAEPAQRLLAVVRTAGAPALTVQTRGSAACVCAVVTSPSGAAGPPSDLLCVD
jgi:hypothetical protein